MSTLQLIHESLVVSSSDDMIGFANEKIDALMGTFRGLAILVGIAFVVINAIVSRLALARIVMSLVVAGLLIWGVWNVTDIKDRVDNEMNAAPAPTTVLVQL